MVDGAGLEISLETEQATESTSLAQKVPLRVQHVDADLKQISQRYIEARNRSKKIRRHLEIEENERGVDHLYLVLHDILDDVDFIMDQQLTVCQLDVNTKDEIHSLFTNLEEQDKGVDLGVGRWKIRVRLAWFTLIATAALTAFTKILVSDLAGVPIPFFG